MNSQIEEAIAQGRDTAEARKAFGSLLVKRAFGYQERDLIPWTPLRIPATTSAIEFEHTLSAICDHGQITAQVDGYPALKAHDSTLLDGLVRFYLFGIGDEHCRNL